jgi:ferric-dicitrate binding protein FerR (iron transport regulator)
MTVFAMIAALLPAPALPPEKARAARTARARCAARASREDTMTDQLLRQLFTGDDQIDDVKRARIWSKLAARLEAPPVRRRWPAVAAASALAAAAVVAIVVVSRTRGDAERLTAPRGAVLTTTLGPHAHAALEGPGALAVAASGDVTRVHLEQGTLYAEFTGAPGRALHITAAGVELEVVGTLFAVEAHDATVCLSVAHGRVRMQAGGEVRFVGGGERACAGRGGFAAVAAITSTTRDALERHARTWTGDAPAVAVASSAAVAAPGVASSASSAAVATPGVASQPLAPAVPPVGGAPLAPAPASPRPPSSAASSPAPRATPPAPSAAPPSESHALVVAGPPSRPAAEPDPAAGSAVATTTAGPPAIDATLYREADAALARGDRDAADRALAELLAIAPQSSLADEALYERARIAFERRAWLAARDLLARLAAIPGTPLAEPGAYLRCRVAVASGEQDVADVLGAYVTAFPDGPHELEVRLQIVGLAYRRGGCAAAARDLAELVRRHPDVPAVADYRTRCGGEP